MSSAADLESRWLIGKLVFKKTLHQGLDIWNSSEKKENANDYESNIHPVHNPAEKCFEAHMENFIEDTLLNTRKRKLWKNWDSESFSILSAAEFATEWHENHESKKSFLASLHRLWCSFRKICLVKSPNLYLERLERFKKPFLLGQRDFWLQFLFNEILVKIYIEMRTRLSLNFFSAFTLLHFVKHFVKISYFLGTWNTFYTSNPQTQHSVLAWLQQQLSFTMFSLICPKANVTPESNIESWEQRIEDMMSHASSCKAQCIGNHCQP